MLFPYFSDVGEHISHATVAQHLILAIVCPPLRFVRQNALSYDIGNAREAQNYVPIKLLPGHTA